MLVVKLGGAAGNEEEALLKELASMSEPWVLVHGTSDAADQLQRRLGQEPRHVKSPSGHSYRVTDEAALEALVMAAAWRNRQLVARLVALGVPAVGLSGADSLAIARRKQAVKAVEEGRTILVRDRSGTVEEIRPDLLKTLLDRGFRPVVTLPAVTSEGGMVNVDADRLAAAIAGGLAGSLRSPANETILVLLTNVSGLLRDPNDPNTLIKELSRSDLEEAMETLAEGRFKRKLLAAKEALDGGVGRIVIADSRKATPIASALAGEGTVIR